MQKLFATTWFIDFSPPCHFTSFSENGSPALQHQRHTHPGPRHINSPRWPYTINANINNYKTPTSIRWVPRTSQTRSEWLRRKWKRPFPYRTQALPCHCRLDASRLPIRAEWELYGHCKLILLFKFPHISLDLLYLLGSISCRWIRCLYIHGWSFKRVSLRTDRSYTDCVSVVARGTDRVF
jgi:hypothetical protein